MEKSQYLSRVSSDFANIWHADAVRPSWASKPLKIWNFQNPRWRRPPSWKIEDRPYLRNSLTDLREILYGDAYWASKWDRKLKFPTFENPRWRTTAILKNGKIAISQPRFEPFRQNLACRRSSTLLSVPTVKNLKFPISKMAAAAILNNRKSAISPERFDGSSRNFVRWRILGLQMGPEVEISNFWKSKMADDRHLEKWKNRNISAAFWAISPKFGMQTQFDPLEHHGGGRHLENRKSAISTERFNVASRNLAYDAQCASKPDRKLKFPTFENPRWRTAVILTPVV